MNRAWLFVVVAWTATAAAQDGAPPATTGATTGFKPPASDSRMFEQEPYDLLILNDKERTTIRVEPVALPNRKIPTDPDKKSTIRVRPLDRSGAQYDVAWGDIAELRLFEQLLLDDAARLGRAGRFDEAFEYFIYFRRAHPDFPGLEDAEIALTFAEAEAALRDGRPETAYARYLRLEVRAPRDPRLADLEPRVTRQFAESLLKADRPRAAKIVADRFAKLHPKHAVTLGLTTLFADASAAHLATAQKAMNERRYLDAQHEAQMAALLAADDGVAMDAYRRAVSAQPTVVVGVVETASPAISLLSPPGRGAGGEGRIAAFPAAISSWADRRLARLLRVPPLEFTYHPAEHPRAAYESDVNRWQADDRDPLSFRILFGAPDKAPSASDAGAALLFASRTDGPAASAALARAAPEVRVIDPRKLEIRFARPHPRPEAVVADVLAVHHVDVEVMTPATLNSMRPPTEPVFRYIRAAGGGTDGPAELYERAFADEDGAVEALLAGDVDMVDRIAPWQVAQLRERREIKLVRYAAPTVHLLLINGANPLLAKPEVRRAIGYAINREAILKHHLKVDRDDLGARPTNGVFPMSRAVDDPLGYAYDTTGPERPYHPQRAFILASMSGIGGAQADGTRAAPLVLAHPGTLTATKACRRIAEYLAGVGIAVVLRPAPLDRTPTTPDGADLTYVSLTATEPMIEIAHWLGPGGLVNIESGPLRAAVAEVIEAESTAAVRSALFNVQRVLHDEALVVPLWQYSEYAAQRARVVRPASVAPTSPYQHVERWNILPQFNEALP